MKKLLSIVMALCSVMGAQAIEISESEAARIASEFVNSHTVSATRGDATLTLAKSSQGYYAYNRGADAGFVIVAADNAMGAQVLGYSASGSLDFDKLPCNLKWWLAQYDLMAVTGASMPQASVTRADAKADIDTLLTCLWNQDTPYNDLCPEYKEGEHCATGCVATALAQVMYYHKWPKQGTGSNSYEWNGKTLSTDFSKHTYDWEHMTDTYDDNSTDEANSAVALLMRDCGYALNMEYDEESAARFCDQSTALFNYFGYDCGIRFILRQYYTNDEWNDILYKELSEKRPILIGGGAHAFVFDGYKQEDGNDWYHVNWGWGGLSNGYFLCSNLNPKNLGIGAASGSYTSNLSATIGIKPAEEGSKSVPEVYCTPLEPITAKQGADVVFETSIYNLSVIDSVFTFGLKVTNESTQEVAYVMNDTIATLTRLETYQGFKISLKDFPTTEGTYDVYPVYFVGDKEYGFRIIKWMPSFTKAEVRGDSISFTYGENAVYPTVSDVTVSDDDPIYATVSFDVSAVVTSKDQDYYGDIYLFLVKDPEDLNSVISVSPAVGIDLRKGESVKATFSLEAPSEAGTYYTIFVNESSSTVFYEPVAISVTALPEDELAFDSNIEISHPTDFDPATDVLTADYELSCTSGYYKGMFYLTFTEDGATQPSYSYTIGRTMLVAGQSKKGVFDIPSGTFDGKLEYGKTYNVAFGYVDGENELKVIPSDATLTTINSSGISGVNANGEPQTINIYSLGGKIVTTQKAAKPNLSTLPAGAYIVKIGDKAQKMVSDK